jgi:hypothetical protein
MKGFTVKVARLPQTIKELDETTRGMMPRINRVLNRHGHGMVAVVKGNLTGRMLKVRSGRLRSAVRKSVGINGTVFALHVGVAGIKYGAIHEKEGYTVVRPTRRKYLTIPVGPAKTPAGNVRFTASDLALANTRVIKSRKPDTLLMQVQKGKKGVWVTVFILKKQVIIYGRPYIRPAVKQEMPKLLHDLGNAIINEKET